VKCRNCSAEITDPSGEMIICEYCGSRFHRSELDPSWKPPGQDPEAVREVHHYHHELPPDKLSVGLGCLIFLFFPLGWVIYFLYRDSSPKKAKAAMVIAAVLTVLMLVGILSGDSGR